MKYLLYSLPIIAVTAAITGVVGYVASNTDTTLPNKYIFETYVPPSASTVGGTQVCIPLQPCTQDNVSCAPGYTHTPTTCVKPTPQAAIPGANVVANLPLGQ